MRLLKPSLFWIAAAAVIANGLYFIWSHRFLPMTDYPDHLYQGVLFQKWMLGTLPADYFLKPYPVPYALVTATLGTLALAFPPEVAGKILLSALVIAFPLASTYLLKSLNPREDDPLLFVPLVFVLNCYFLWGELSYVLGLVLLFLYCGRLLRNLATLPQLRLTTVALFLILLYFTHGFVWGVALLVTGVLIVFERRLTSLLPRFALAAAPGFLLAAWYLLARLASGQIIAPWQFWTFNPYAGRFVAAFAPFPEFRPWISADLPYMSWAAIVNLLSCVAIGAIWLLCVALWWRGRRDYSSVLAAALVCLATTVAGGFAVADFISPGERFFYPALWIALCWLRAVLPAQRSQTAAAAVRATLCALLLAQAVYIDVIGGHAANGLATMYTQLRDATTPEQFCATYRGYNDQSHAPPGRTGLTRFFTNIPSAERLPYYLFLERDKPVPLFKVGIFDYHGPPNDRELCP